MTSMHSDLIQGKTDRSLFYSLNHSGKTHLSNLKNRTKIARLQNLQTIFKFFAAKRKTETSKR